MYARLHIFTFAISKQSLICIQIAWFKIRPARWLDKVFWLMFFYFLIYFRIVIQSWFNSTAYKINDTLPYPAYYVVLNEHGTLRISYIQLHLFLFTITYIVEHFWSYSCVLCLILHISQLWSPRFLALTSLISMLVSWTRKKGPR